MVLFERKERVYFVADTHGKKRVLRKELLIDGVWTAANQYAQRDVVSGLVTEMILPNGGTVSYEHDAENRVLMVENALGQVISTDYDEQGRLLQVTTSFKAGQDSVVKYTRDAAGHQVSMENAIGVIMNNEYDDLNQLIRETQAAGLAEERVNEFDYDARGSRVQGRVYDAGKVNLVATTYYYYDSLGRRVGVNWNPTNNDKSGDLKLPVLTEYDASSNQSAQTDGEGNRTQWQYDAYNRVERIIFSDTADYLGGNDGTVGYDDLGNQL